MTKRHDPAQPIHKRLSISATDATLKDNTLTGAAAGIGNLDSHDDVIFPGAFSPAVIAEFLRSGFVAQGHEWGDLPIAIPVMAEERGRMLYTEATFHSHQDAQDARIVASERIAAGKSVGLSVGFFCGEDGCMWFESGVKLLEFARNNGYDLALFDVPSISQFDGWVRAIVKISRWVEYSLVTIPANPEAEAMSAKAHTKPVSTVRELEDFLRDAGMPKSLRLLSISNLRASLRDAAAIEGEPQEEQEQEPPADAPPVDAEAEAELLQLRARAIAARARITRKL
jgi:phage head maturation protease